MTDHAYVRSNIDLVIGRGICEALGIDPNMVRSITIRCTTDEAPLVEVECYPKVGNGLVSELQRYRLVPESDDV